MNDNDILKKSIYTIDDKPWIVYFQIDEETGRRYLREDTPAEIVKKYNEFLQEKAQLFLNNNETSINHDNEIINVVEFAKNHGYNGAKYIGNWKEYKVYEPYVSGNDISFTGLPLVILVNDKGEIRMSTSDEAMATLDDKSFSNDVDYSDNDGGFIRKYKIDENGHEYEETIKFGDFHCNVNNINSKDNKLERKELISITQQFVNDIKEYKIFKIPDKLYLSYFRKIEELFNSKTFVNDNRFVTYGRLDFLQEELILRLNDENLKKENPNWKDKWDNRFGAFLDLYDFIIGDRYFAPHNIPKEKSFSAVLVLNDQYYKDGIICKEEKDIILKMVNQIKEYIKNNYLSEIFEYEFIPYKQIGSIRLDKIDKSNFKHNYFNCFQETEFNEVMCRPTHLDYEEDLKRFGEPVIIYIKYGDNKIKITSYFDRFVNDLKNICDDIIFKEKIEDGKKYVLASSGKLGIIIQSIDNIIYYICFCGKEEFKRI